MRAANGMRAIAVAAAVAMTGCNAILGSEWGELSVETAGTGGVGGTLIAKLIQGSIDKKLNPIEIMRLDKVSFGVPIQNAGNIRMKAVSVRPEITAGSLQIHVIYDFLKG